jgi:hypothetical protein
MLFDDDSVDSLSVGYETTYMIKNGDLYTIGNNAV